MLPAWTWLVVLGLVGSETKTTIRGTSIWSRSGSLQAEINGQKRLLEILAELEVLSEWSSCQFNLLVTELTRALLVYPFSSPSRVSCSHPSRHCLYLRKGAYTTGIQRPSWWKITRKQAKMTCERYDSSGRGRGKCSVPNNQLVTIQCDGEKEEIAFVKLADQSEFKRYLSKGTQYTLGLIWSTQKRAGGHAEYRSNSKGDDLYAECKKIDNGWKWEDDNSGWMFHT